MPFVLAHPVAVLPLQRTLGGRLDPAALVVGSMTPDLALFVPLGVARAQSHSLLGLLWFGLPVGVAAYVFFHLIVAPLLVRVMEPRREDPGRSWPTGWAHGAIPARPAGFVLLSLLLGGGTHLLWDAFTHGSGAAVRWLPALRDPLFDLGGYRVFVYKLLQHGSSLAGVALLAWMAWRARCATRADTDVDAETEAAAVEPERERLVRRLLVVAVLLPPIVVGVARGWPAADPSFPPVVRLQHFAGAAIVSGGTALLVSLLVVGIGLRLTSRSDEVRP